MRKTRSKKRTKIRVWLPSSPVRSGLKSRLPLSLGPRGPESSAPFICLHPHPHTMPHQRVCPVSGCWVGAQGRSPVFWNLLSLSAPSPACPPANLPQGPHLLEALIATFITWYKNLEKFVKLQCSIYKHNGKEKKFLRKEYYCIC